MKSKKTLLVAALCGAVIGAQFAHVDFHVITSRFPALALDRSLLSYRGFLLASIAVWALFGLYWESAEKNAAAALSSESRGSRGLHVFLANISLMLEIVPIRG